MVMFIRMLPGWIISRHAKELFDQDFDLAEVFSTSVVTGTVSLLFVLRQSQS